MRAPAAVSLPIWRADIVALAGRDQRAHAAVLVARIADLGRCQPVADRRLDRVEMLGRGHGAADGGAFLPRLDRHLVDDFLDEQVEFGRARRGVGAKQRGVEAVLLGDELDALALDDRMGAELERGRGRAGEADHVLAGQMVEQVADAADDQLHAPGGSSPLSIITRNAASHR